MKHSALSLFAPGMLASATVTPPPVAGYAMWFAPESSIFSDTAGTTPAVNNGEIKRWNDLSGAGNHVIHVVGDSSSGPRYLTANTVNGKRAIRFADGFGVVPSRTWLQLDSFALGTVGHTIFCVGRNNSLVATDTYTDFVGWVGPSGLRSHTSLAFLASYNDASGSYPGGGSIPLNTWVSAACRFDNAANTRDIYKSGVSQASATDNWAGVSPGTLRIGGRSGSVASSLSGDIAEVIVYPTALSGANITLVDTYLRTKYAL